ncbi:putative deoxyribonucleoside kinase [Yersinia phage YerA41]|nr:putative deoxyribonucleoside kinase [Yersinia phage YerA41]
MIVFVDGSTRVGKDFLIEELMSIKYPELFGLTQSNYEFLKQFSSNGGTDGMYINTINIISNIGKLINWFNSVDYNNMGCPVVIINRSILSDFTEYLMLAMVNRAFLDNKGPVDVKGSLLKFYDELFNKYPQYLESVKLTLNSLNLPHQNQFHYLLIEEPRYNVIEYNVNLTTDKAKYHYIAILNRLNVIDGVDSKKMNEFRMIYNHIMGLLIDSVNGNRITDEELFQVLGKF